MVLIIEKQEPKVAFQFKKGEKIPIEFNPFFESGQLVLENNIIQIHTRANIKKGRKDIFQKLEENDWLFLSQPENPRLIKLSPEEFRSNYELC